MSTFRMENEHFLKLLQELMFGSGRWKWLEVIYSKKEQNYLMRALFIKKLISIQLVSGQYMFNRSNKTEIDKNNQNKNKKELVIWSACNCKNISNA